MERLPGTGSNQPRRRMSGTSQKIVATCFCVFTNCGFLGCGLVVCFFFFGCFVQNSQLVPLTRLVKKSSGSTSCCARSFLQISTRFAFCCIVSAWGIHCAHIVIISKWTWKITAMILARTLSLAASRWMLCACTLLLNPTRLPYLLLWCCWSFLTDIFTLGLHSTAEVGLQAVDGTPWGFFFASHRHHMTMDLTTVRAIGTTLPTMAAIVLCHSVRLLPAQSMHATYLTHNYVHYTGFPCRILYSFEHFRVESRCVNHLCTTLLRFACA